MINIDPGKLFFTSGLMADKGKGFDSVEDDYLFEMAIANLVKEQFDKEPDQCFDGGNDKSFFTITFRRKKLFVAANEVDGLTVMLPEEY